jgi:hypothetical protein
MLQREPKMNRAPAKDLIPILIQEPSLELLRSFFRARVEWSSYPIFHERMMSSTLFDDYVPLLEQKPEQLSATLDYALTLALEEDERYVLCIVFLIASLCFYAPKEIVPSAAQLQMIEELHERVKPLSFLINLFCDKGAKVKTELSLSINSFVISIQNFYFNLCIEESL